jgi:DNA-binding LacI/PurR family transcriptional regulator
MTALMALDFLASNTVEIPEQISVIGFDDTEEALQANLASYNFNIAALAGAMFDHILGGHVLKTKQARQPVVINGMVMQRRSLGKAPHR